MKRIFTLTIALLFIGSIAVAQETTPEQDAKAKAILDKLSKDMKSYKTISVAFKLKIKGEGINSSLTGKAGIKGEKYFYSDNEQKIWSNGVNVWQLEMEEGTCYKSDIEDNEDALSPKKLLTIWEDGYKYKYIGETEKNGKVVNEIKLYPKDPKKSKYTMVTMFVNKSDGKINNMVIKRKDGLTIDYSITKLTPNLQLSDSKFKFDQSLFPNVHLEDL